MNYRFALVAVEGLACVGKTTLLRRLAALRQDVLIVPEVVPGCERLPVVPSDQSTSLISAGRYFGNDVLKSHLALRYTSSRPCALDRYYVSTLSHRCAELNLSDRELEVRVRDAVTDLFMLLTQPDVWIYITENPSLSWRRYVDFGAVDAESCWATEEGTKAIAHAQACCMRVLGERSAVLHVRSDTLVEEAGVRALLHRIDHFLNPPAQIEATDTGD